MSIDSNPGVYSEIFLAARFPDNQESLLSREPDMKSGIMT